MKRAKNEKLRTKWRIFGFRRPFYSPQNLKNPPDFWIFFWKSPPPGSPLRSRTLVNPVYWKILWLWDEQGGKKICYKICYWKYEIKIWYNNLIYCNIFARLSNFSGFFIKYFFSWKVKDESCTWIPFKHLLKKWWWVQLLLLR